MQPTNKWLRVVGWVLSGLLGALLLFSAAMKLSAAPPAVEGFSKFGLKDWMLIIGVGELVSTLLFLVPRTAVPGTLLLSSYLGGAIVTHMQHGESIVGPSVFLVALWVAAGLRVPELFRTVILGKA
jgi:hypothetical protein